MGQKEFHYRWEYELSASPAALWPAVADTNRFNRDAGVPALKAVAFAETDDGGGGAAKRPKARRLSLSKLGLNVEWEEEPFEWVRPHRFGVVRRYRGGPVAEMRVAAELHEREGGGTRLVYEVWATPRGALGRAAIPLQIGRISARRFADTFRRYDEQAGRDSLDSGLLTVAHLDMGERALLASLEHKLLETGADAGLVGRLVETIERGDELTLTRLRPYVLADCWRAPRREVLQLCLLATRAGLLDLRWELLCPLCRGASRSVPTLAEIRSGQHCESCNVDFVVNFDRSVEVVFRPNASLRRVAEREFCVGGPQVTPHIVAQQLVAPGERRTLSTRLEEGRYRVRAHGTQGGVLLLVAPRGENAAVFRADEEPWPSGEFRLSATPELVFENATAEKQLFILERTAWNDQAATAAEVTALQLFRDLFATEALRPGDRISVGQMTILFTDLRDSTRLYREIGDAVAFGAVMNHFDVLREAIAHEGGSIVKTLGDAVMAVFPRPAPALRAVLSSQRRLASPLAGARPLALKAGIHNGACIAVTLNGRLDYFGSNVNIAARLEPLSTGRDCVISSDVRRDPEVEELLADPAQGFTTEPLEARLKGFDEEAFELWRVMSKQEEAE
ncbi:MAG TPA: adenylate/guanylate cyclase domain-containing protein [Pyrinomonadaceae bacterium]|nr:adenylate/guanylate cyclase domain-containing protein [Pyrinomonadaceae bacterium]